MTSHENPLSRIGIDVTANLKLYRESFHVTSYQANFASHHTRDRHVGFLTPQAGMGKYNKMSQNFLFSSYHNTKLQPSDENISTHTRLKF